MAMKIGTPGKSEGTNMPKELRNAKTTSFISEGTVLEGVLEVKGGIRIDGALKGTIHSDSVVILGDTAQVQANIVAAVVVSSGKVEGDIHSETQVQVNLPGSVKGSIRTRELILEKGVFFEGSCQIIEPEA